MIAAIAGATSAAFSSGGSAKLDARCRRGPIRRVTMSRSTALSPFIALASASRDTSPQAPSNNCSTIIVARLRIPGGLPAGLPELTLQEFALDVPRSLKLQAVFRLTTLRRLIRPKGLGIGRSLVSGQNCFFHGRLVLAIRIVYCRIYAAEVAYSRTNSEHLFGAELQFCRGAGALCPARRSGRGVAHRLLSWVAATEPADRGEGAEPGAGRGEQHVNRVLGVADDREGREHVPDGAPIGGPDALPAADRRVEEDIGRIGRRGRGEHAQGNKRVDAEEHKISPLPVPSCAAAATAIAVDARRRSRLSWQE